MIKKIHFLSLPNHRINTYRTSYTRKKIPHGILLLFSGNNGATGGFQNKFLVTPSPAEGPTGRADSGKVTDTAIYDTFSFIIYFS